MRLLLKLVAAHGFEPRTLRVWTACSSQLSYAAEIGADDQDWTGDLILTKDTLCRLSYISILNWLRGPDLNQRPSGYEPDELPTAPPRDNRWWWGLDSNQRSETRQIYSLLPLATREPHRLRQEELYIITSYLSINYFSITGKLFKKFFRDSKN